MNAKFMGMVCLALTLSGCRMRNYHSTSAPSEANISAVISSLQSRLVSDVESVVPKFSTLNSKNAQDYLTVLTLAMQTNRNALMSSIGLFMTDLTKVFPPNGGDPSLSFSHFLANLEKDDDLIKQAKLDAIMMLLCSNANGPAACYQQTVGLPDPLALIDTLRAMQNKFLTWGEFGKTAEGRSLVFAEITNPEGAKTEKSVIWLSGGIHPNEPISIPILTEFANRLSTSKDPVVAEWLGKYRFVIVPLLNPDGWEISSKKTSWRKSARRFGDKNLIGGVNLNRNFPTIFLGPIAPIEKIIDWNFAGPSAGSEPETQAIMALVNSLNPVAAVDYHSDAHFLVIPDSAMTDKGFDQIFRAVSRELGSQQLTEQNEPGKYQFGTSQEIFKTRVGGTLEEWIWEATGALSMSIEHLTPSAVGAESNSWPAENIRKNAINNAWDTMARLVNFIDKHSIRAFVKTAGGLNIQYKLSPHGSNETSNFRFDLKNSAGLLHTVAPSGTDMDLLLFRSGALIRRVPLGKERPLNLGNIEL